jgi:hypothetical protein
MVETRPYGFFETEKCPFIGVYFLFYAQQKWNRYRRKMKYISDLHEDHAAGSHHWRQ